MLYSKDSIMNDTLFEYELQSSDNTLEIKLSLSFVFSLTKTGSTFIFDRLPLKKITDKLNENLK